jgi:DNA-binding LytR/AlgR family response regulator
MSGGELAKAICAMRPTLPVILITGYSDLGILKEFNDSRIVLKPFTEDDLVPVVNPIWLTIEAESRNLSVL